ncbi:MAG: hypothetical protein JSU66_06200 [Deltaproteobacteria bacterium]|nr:MAG: hypothetical protein JSU66_06200 [Deltaproteobacteria bacterium]
MDEEKVKEIVSGMVFWSGKKDMAIDEIAMLQPGLARIMPEIGNRTWKLYYAARAGNWDNARWQWKETKKLFEVCACTRPKHEEAIEEFLAKNWSTLEAPIANRDLDAFLAAYDEIVEAANSWHVQKDVGHIRWKVPSEPPPDLDLTPRK